MVADGLGCCGKGHRGLGRRGREQGKGARVFVPKWETKDCLWVEETCVSHGKTVIYKGKRGNPVLG